MRLALLREAEKEFLEKGFVNASVRKVVKAAGTTIGNFYNYFNNKEALFEELVKDEYGAFLYFVQNHEQRENIGLLQQISDPLQWRQVLGSLLEKVMPVFTDRFVLLLECSEGTRFADMRLKIVQLVKEHFLEHMKETGSLAADEAFAEIIAEQLLDGILLIMRRHKDVQTRKRLMAEHMLLYLLGAMGLMGMLGMKV